MESLRLRFKNRESRLLMASLIFWLPVIVFMKLAGEILEQKPIKTDTLILEFIHSHATPFWDDFFKFVTNIGGVESVIALSFLIGLYLLYKKQRQKFILLAASVGGAGMVNVILKLLFHRDRPSLWANRIIEIGYSFPSGHAMLSSALIFSIIVLTWRTKFKYITVLFGGLLIFLIGFSRLYLGVHYPSDVLAGWSLSLVWTLIALVIIKELSFSLRRSS